MPRSAVLIALVALLVSGCGGPARDTRTHSATPPSPTARARVPEACTNVWVGPRTGGSWAIPSNWSGRREPGSTDQACLDRGTAVTISGGERAVGSIIDGGTLTVVGSVLHLTDVSATSEIGRLRMARSALAGQGPLVVTLELWWGAGSALDAERSGRNTAMGSAGHVTIAAGAQLHEADGRGPSPNRPGFGASSAGAGVACGPHSPPGVPACAGDDTRSHAGPARPGAASPGR